MANITTMMIVMVLFAQSAIIRLVAKMFLAQWLHQQIKYQTLDRVFFKQANAISVNILYHGISLMDGVKKTLKTPELNGLNFTRIGHYKTIKSMY
ncbi:MAG: hypothetical protein ACI9JG_000778 [Alphaproteobacteria bacterium]|jgi:hypothetical protein